MANYQVTIDWERLHRLASDLDMARRDMANHGQTSICDPFGGSYYGPNYEGRGLIGAIKILRAARELQRTAWDAVHSAKRRLEDASQPIDSDYDTAWWSMDCGGRDDMRHETHQGAAWRASRYGGRVERERLLRQDRIDRRRNRVLDQTQGAVNAAMRVHAILSYLAEIGLTEYDPENQICGVYSGRINLTWLRWLAGKGMEQDGGIPIDDVRDIRILVEQE